MFIPSNNIPMISAPIPWHSYNDNYCGGYYRPDLYYNKLIHSHSLCDHSIKNIKVIIDCINYMQSIPLVISSDLLNYIN